MDGCKIHQQTFNYTQEISESEILQASTRKNNKPKKLPLFSRQGELLYASITQNPVQLETRALSDTGILRLNKYVIAQAAPKSLMLEETVIRMLSSVETSCEQMSNMQTAEPYIPVSMPNR